ncbi:MAG: hypothetical protein ACXWQ5_06010 [Ktedonobacterales bacterium]
MASYGFKATDLLSVRRLLMGRLPAREVVLHSNLPYAESGKCAEGAT